MDKDELINKIIEKKEFSQLPLKDVEVALSKFNRNEHLDDEEKIKKTRDLLRRVYSGFSGKKLFLWENKRNEEILEKHLSTRERFEHYEEIYSRILKKLPNKISIIDLGSGVNGFSYDFFNKIGKEVNYIAVEAVGQLVDLTNKYFKKEKIKGKVYHMSLFELENVSKIIKKTKKPRVVFMFKIVDSLENLERDYTKKLLNEIMPSTDRCIISFATESWIRRKKFHVQRNWIINFIKEKWHFIDDFTINGERYLSVEKN